MFSGRMDWTVGILDLSVIMRGAIWLIIENARKGPNRELNRPITFPNKMIWTSMIKYN